MYLLIILLSELKRISLLHDIVPVSLGNNIMTKNKTPFAKTDNKSENLKLNPFVKRAKVPPLLHRYQCPCPSGKRIAISYKRATSPFHVRGCYYLTETISEWMEKLSRLSKISLFHCDFSQ